VKSALRRSDCLRAAGPGSRCSELVAIEVGHVGWATEGTEIMLPRSKTDQLGEGIVKAIP